LIKANMLNPFFKNNGPFKISSILELIDIKQDQLSIDQDVIDIKDLFTLIKTI